MLTKAKLQEYLDKGELVPIGTKLITVQLGECEVVNVDKNKDYPYCCQRVGDIYYYYDKEFKFEIWHNQTSLIDPTPEPLSSPFTREELEVIKSDIYGKLNEIAEKYRKPRREIINKINALQPKQKTLADLKEGEFFWDVETFEKREYQGRNNVLIIYKKDGIDCAVAVKDFDEYFQLTPPSPQQIATARQAAIDEVNKRFDSLEKEVGNG